MTSHDALLKEIEEFLLTTGMNVSTFGRMASNNGKLVKRMRSGCSVTLPTADAIRAFMTSELAARNVAAARAEPAKRRRAA